MNQIPSEAESLPSLGDYVGVIRRRKWSVVGPTILALSAALGISLSLTPMYKSQARVLVDPPDLSANSTAVTNLETERELLGSIPVARIVAEEVGYSGNLDELLDRMSVDVAPGTEILEVSYEHPDPKEAAELAQTFADGYLSLRRDRARGALLATAESVQRQLTSREEELREVNAQLEENPSPSSRAALEARVVTIAGQIAALQQQLALLSPPEDLYVGEVIEPAEVPREASSPRFVLIAIVAAGLGLFVGLGFAFLRERLDSRVKGEQDVAAYSGSYLVSAIPVSKLRGKKRGLPVVLSDPRSSGAEAFRSLCARILYLARSQPLRTIVITSPGQGEGKSATAANLGVILAQSEKRVILLSADLRRPRLHRFLEVRESPGLTDILSGRAIWEDAIVQTAIPGLRLIPSGDPGMGPEFLGGESMSALLDKLKRVADYVIVDGAPILGVADSLSLSSIADGVLLVADAQVTTRAALMRARRELDHVGASIVGAVLNRFDPARVSSSPGPLPYDPATFGTPGFGQRPQGFDSQKEPAPITGEERSGFGGSE